MSMLYRIEVGLKETLNDPAAASLVAEMKSLGITPPERIRTSRLFWLEADFDRAMAERVARELFSDPIVEGATVNEPLYDDAGARLVEVVRKPGVMDPVVASIRKGLEDRKLAAGHIATGRKYLFFYGASITGSRSSGQVNRASVGGGGHVASTSLAGSGSRNARIAEDHDTINLTDNLTGVITHFEVEHMAQAVGNAAFRTRHRNFSLGSASRIQHRASLRCGGHLARASTGINGGGFYYNITTSWGFINNRQGRSGFEAYARSGEVASSARGLHTGSPSIIRGIVIAARTS